MGDGYKAIVWEKPGRTLSLTSVETGNVNYSPLNFREKLTQFSDHWSPKVIAEMNDYQFKLVKVQGDFVWHDHPDTDEVFIVLDGQMTIQFRDGAVELSAGEMYVVPKGVEHKTWAREECHMLLVEPQGVVNTGDVVDPKTAQNDLWV
ncbi:cupin domain-containing protein [Leptothoe sp. PORK10 BA2]|nr:cupin domain-containing protein [Leptothoe sp. PORK10 BA2]MEA5464878.1 cupin domain-containing protein [Leptothoe sp. PORK10 BA2]